jgi:hypothetical protein
MRVTINFDDDELKFALQKHLDEGVPVQEFIQAAIRFYTDMFKKEMDGQYAVGFGDKSRFKSYNTEVSPLSYLRRQI